jgi:hypothetical protein
MHQLVPKCAAIIAQTGSDVNSSLHGIEKF